MNFNIFRRSAKATDTAAAARQGFVVRRGIIEETVNVTFTADGHYRTTAAGAAQPAADVRPTSQATIDTDISHLDFPASSIAEKMASINELANELAKVLDEMQGTQPKTEADDEQVIAVSTDLTVRVAVARKRSRIRKIASAVASAPKRAVVGAAKAVSKAAHWTARSTVKVVVGAKHLAGMAVRRAVRLTLRDARLVKAAVLAIGRLLARVAAGTLSALEAIGNFVIKLAGALLRLAFEIIDVLVPIAIKLIWAVIIWSVISAVAASVSTFMFVLLLILAALVIIVAQDFRSATRTV